VYLHGWRWRPHQLLLLLLLLLQHSLRRQQPRHPALDPLRLHEAATHRRTAGRQLLLRGRRAAAAAPDAARVAGPLEVLEKLLLCINNINVTVRGWLTPQCHPQVLVEHAVIQRLMQDASTTTATCCACASVTHAVVLLMLLLHLLLLRKPVAPSSSSCRTARHGRRLAAVAPPAPVCVHS
jgi:hypothetical protein